MGVVAIGVVVGGGGGGGESMWLDVWVCKNILPA